MTVKIRRVDFYPDEYMAGVMGKLSAFDQGVYWMVCSLIYSKGGPIDNDHVWLSHLFADTHWRTVRASLDRLIAMGKVELCEGGQITVRRCAEELQRSVKRTAEAVQNGRKGGRPSSKNKDLVKAGGYFPEKLTNNYQLTTNGEVFLDRFKDDELWKRCEVLEGFEQPLNVQRHAFPAEVVSKAKGEA